MHSQIVCKLLTDPNRIRRKLIFAVVVCASIGGAVFGQATQYGGLNTSQKTLFSGWAQAQNKKEGSVKTTQARFEGMSESERSTYSGISNALYNIRLTDSNGRAFSRAIDLVQAVAKNLRGDYFCLDAPQPQSEPQALSAEKARVLRKSTTDP